jgi:hypothetical protein
MPLLGYSKHKLGSGSTRGRLPGTQNYLCGAQAAAVLLVLAVTAAWPGGWWLARSSACPSFGDHRLAGGEVSGQPWGVLITDDFASFLLAGNLEIWHQGKPAG